MGRDEWEAILGLLSSRLDEIKSSISDQDFLQTQEQIAECRGIAEDLRPFVGSNSTRSTIFENRRITMAALDKRIEKGLRLREAGKRDDGNVAFKCNWNDQGYKAPCSAEAREHNQRMMRAWCRVGPCSKDPIVVKEGDLLCYEAGALLDCVFGAGWDNNGKVRINRPRKIRSARTGKFAVLTTEPPGAQKRLVVGMYLIDRVMDDPNKETMVFGARSTMIDDMLGYGINFWDYYANPNKERSQVWSSGLFRYMGDGAVAGVLRE